MVIRLEKCVEIVNMTHQEESFSLLSRTLFFFGPLILLFCTSGDVWAQFRSQGGFPHLHASLSACNTFLRFTFGITPADLLAASMAAKLFHPHT